MTNNSTMLDRTDTNSDKHTDESTVVEYDYEEVTENRINITHFRVAESERRNGIGSAVIEALFDYFAAEGYVLVFVDFRGDTAARNFLTEKNNMDYIPGTDSDGYVRTVKNVADRAAYRPNMNHYCDE